MNSPAFTIAAVERDTGLAKDTLRVWERRYGFPTPGRDDNGERLYPSEQVAKLRLIKRLMDQGFRPGKLMSIDDAELALLSTASPPVAALADDEPLQSELLALIGEHNAPALRSALNQAMHRKGLESFVLNTVPQLNQAVGEGWMRGDLAVFEEHLYTEQMQALLRQAISALPGGTGNPRVILTTPPDEQHILGLLMGETLLTLEGAACISLGTQTPITDIARAANAHQADIVALSFSAAFPPRQIEPMLTQLRLLLPEGVALWAGGSGIARTSSVAGATLIYDLPELLAALRTWRSTEKSKLSKGASL